MKISYLDQKSKNFNKKFRTYNTGGKDKRYFAIGILRSVPYDMSEEFYKKYLIDKETGKVLDSDVPMIEALSDWRNSEELFMIGFTVEEALTEFFEDMI